MQWQYHTVSLETWGLFINGNVDVNSLQDRLQELGNEGWDLVSTTPVNTASGTSSIILILKRELNQNDIRFTNPETR